MGWRLIDTGIADPYFVTAADDALAQIQKEKPTDSILHFYRRKIPTISMGRSAKKYEDINYEFCRTNNIPIIRRTTGGGTIFTDPGCLIFSFIENKNKISGQNIFKTTCSHIISALQSLNIPAKFKPPNDVLVHGKKISGSAHIQKDTISLIHGTILIQTDLTMMHAALNQSKNSNVSTLHQEIGSHITILNVKRHLIKAFEHQYHTSFTPSTFTEKEEQIITELLQKKYHTTKWNMLR